MTWRKHKPRIWRRYGARTRATVGPSMERREWLWVIDRLVGPRVSEVARGRVRRLVDARRVAGIFLGIYDALECAEVEWRRARKAEDS